MRKNTLNPSITFFALGTQASVFLSIRSRRRTNETDDAPETVNEIRIIGYIGQRFQGVIMIGNAPNALL